MTDCLKVSDRRSLNRALSILRAGGLVAIPTETVYGLAADAENGAAVAGIYEAKGRPSFNPLIAHCSDLAMAERYGVFNEAARALADKFWPGALTLVVPHRIGLSDILRAGLNTIALRVPRGPMASIVKALDRPLAAPSANLSGRVSATEAHHVMTQLAGKIDLLLDNGPTDIGLESTIVSCVGDKAVLLRSGGITLDQLEHHLGYRPQAAEPDAKITAPGMMTSHYAPKGKIRLNMTALTSEDGALNFGASNLKAKYSYNLSERGDLKEAASRLFSCLAQFDEKNVDTIAVAPIPIEGLGLAINDRLARAAVSRV